MSNEVEEEEAMVGEVRAEALLQESIATELDSNQPPKKGWTLATTELNNNYTNSTRQLRVDHDKTSDPTYKIKRLSAKGGTWV